MSFKLKPLLIEGIEDKYKTKDGNWDYNKLENCTNELDFYMLFKYSSKKSFWTSQQAMEAVLEALFMAMAKKPSMWNVPIPGRKTIQVPIFDAVAIRLAKDSTQSDHHFAHNPLKFCWAMNRNTKYHKIPINTSLKSIKSLLWPELANLTTDAAVYDIWISPETGKLQRHGKSKSFFDFPDDVAIKYQPFLTKK